MNKSIWTIAGGTAVLCAAVIAVPAYTSASRPQEQEVIAPEVHQFNLEIDNEGGSWLGVETLEVNGERAKELKLPAERGALLGKIAPDSPASKAGLKENDVVTEVNGQHVEGAMQFRRMIRETPAGRSVQLTVWRDGRTQTLSVTLGKSEELRHNRMFAGPGNFTFRMPAMPPMPDLPEVAEIPDMPSTEWGGMIMGGQPRLGIDAEDLNGQLGSFFGAPEGEGILVRSVNSGSPAEKAGLKAGDVITSLNGDRIRSVGDLRQKLSARHEDADKDADKDKDKTKERTVKLGVLRNKSEMSLSVELPAPQAMKTKRLISRRTNI
jgi:serine protease Do